MATQLASTTVCSVCGEPLNVKGDCLVCLLRAGLDQSVIEIKPDTSFVFGDYQLLEEIGRGGQAVVYRARQKSLNRIVALKVIGLGHWESTPHLKRFRHEAEAAARLEHPQIVPIYEIGESDGSCYFSMKFVEGGPLAEVLMRDPMSARRAAELLAKIARTVHFAHQRGILHRDIKPGNILLDRLGEPHLTDFGLARLMEQESTITHSSDVLGTPSYMSPEQAAGRVKELTAAADVYSLGAVFYQMLTGEPPFVGGTTYETIRLVLDSEPRNPRVRNPKIDRDVSTICLKCLEKDPKRRYSSALALAEDLEHWLKREPIQARRAGPFGRGKKWVRRNPSIAVMAALLLALAVPLGVMIWKGESKSSPASNPAPEKSIAVLPFENLSRDPDNAFFADGVQDEILTDLARIADLKVISRASVMHYKIGAARNLREIAQQLGVANVVEGSVQRSGNRVRVNAQLVDARNDAHLWAQTYDRDLADVFAIQSEVAKSIADQLQAKLSPSEKKAIELPPTSDLVAFDLYARAKDLILTASAGSTAKSDLLRAIELLNQAIARDRSFFDAYCQLAYAHGLLYLLGQDHTPARLVLAETAVDAAARLRPDAGETHLARARSLYQGHRDYNGALAELELALQTLPNDARIYQLKGFIQRRQKGRYEEATRTLEHAIDLDPRNVLTLNQIAAYNYPRLRRFTEAKAVWDRLLAIQPDDATAQVGRARFDFDWKADTRPLHQTVNSIRATNPAALPRIVDDWLLCALAERDALAAKNALATVGDEPITLSPGNVLLNRPFVEGLIARMTQDDAAAQRAFAAARVDQEKIVQSQPNDGSAVCVLGLIDAGLGRKEKAIREGRRAIDLLPVEKDLPEGMDMIKYFAMIAAWVGDKDLACEQLALAISGPSSLTYGELKLLPLWDPLRGDPRFEKLVEEAKLPIALSASTSGVAGQANVAPAPEKSIAVLPFENLSEEKANEFFADGVQDEILTDLARVADLKVISRTSVMHYKSGVARNLREIGQQLGVSNVVEGSVQRSGNRVRVNAQLIDARTDRHLWGQTYDRDLADVFAIQSEIAKTIAEQLQAKLTGQEQQNIAAKPTENLAAYDAYLRGLACSQKTGRSSANDVAAQKYLREAVRLDPKFAQAWALLSYVDAAGCISLSLQPTVALREEARQAAETAFTLQPNLGEALHAKGYYYYACLKDYDTAERYFEQAHQVLPNSSRISESLAYLSRRRGQWDRSESAFNEAERRDPRNTVLLTQHALTYIALRRLPEGLRKLDQTLDITPDDPYPVAVKASIAQMEGDLPRAAALLAPLQPNADQTQVLEVQAYQGILERHPEQIIARLKEVLLNPDRALGYNIGDLRFYLGWAQEVAGDHTAAQETWRRARSELEPLLKEQSENYLLISALAFSDMGLGDNAAALKLAEGSMAGNPMEKDALIGARHLEIFARVAAGMGEADRAITTIQKLLSITYSGVIERQLPLTPALLRLDPMFDPLRGDPRFEKLVEEAKQPVALRPSTPAPEKSIAVLPFENLSNDREDAPFADGIQDDVLTKLAKIADLKVISRTSVMQYRGKRDTHQIGDALRVSHVLEGTVRKTGAWLHINAQLVDTRTDTNVWAEQYDRDLKEMFAVQSEIAQKVAECLHAKISPAQKLAIERSPTANLTAFELYNRAKNLILAWHNSNTDKANLLRAADLLSQAVAQDPSFFQAYCQLSWVHDQLYQFRFDRTPMRLALAEAAIESAFRLRPDAGEAHLARAGHLYRAYRDYDRALAELETARQTLPNDARLFELKGYIERRRPGGDQEEALRNLEYAVDLDPRNIVILGQAALSYDYLRRYGDEEAALDRALAIDPNDVVTKISRAYVEFHWKANTRPLHQLIDELRAKNPGVIQSVADSWLSCALAERDPAAAANALAALGGDSVGNEVVKYSSRFIEGLIARMTKDDEKASTAFSVARAEQEKLVRGHPDDAGVLGVLGSIDAALGRKEEALREGRRAIELVPVEKDAIGGTRVIVCLAMIAAWVGDNDLACEQLTRAIRYPACPSYGQLKLLPFWDPLRGDPRFEQIVASLAPKEAQPRIDTNKH